MIEKEPYLVKDVIMSLFKKQRKMWKKEVKYFLIELFRKAEVADEVDDFAIYGARPRIMSRMLTAGIQMFTGVVVFGLTSILLAVNFLRSFFGVVPSTAGFILFFITMVGAVGLFLAGVRSFSLFYRYQAMIKLTAGYSRVRIAALCQRMERSLPDLSRDIYRMIKGGLLPENALHLERKELVLEPSSLEDELPEEERQTVFCQHKKGSKIPFGLVGVIWVMYVLAYLVYSAPFFYLPLILSLVVYPLARIVFPSDKWLTVIARPEDEPSLADSEQEEINAFLSSAEQHMKDLTALSRSISKEEMRTSLQEIILLAKDIFQIARAQPEKIGQLRQFVAYYLPMTIKLLSNYRGFERQSQKGENILKTMKEIEEFMGTVLEAFKKELDGLFEDKAIDISTDIAVMKSMMELDRPK